MFGVESNRRISIDCGQYIQIQTLEDWDDNGSTVYLKDDGVVKVYIPIANEDAKLRAMI